MHASAPVADAGEAGFRNLQALFVRSKAALRSFERYKCGVRKTRECRSEGYRELYGTHKEQELTRYHNYPSPSDASASDGDEETSSSPWEHLSTTHLLKASSSGASPTSQSSSPPNALGNDAGSTSSLRVDA